MLKRTLTSGLMLSLMLGLMLTSGLMLGLMLGLMPSLTLGLMLTSGLMSGLQVPGVYTDAYADAALTYASTSYLDDMAYAAAWMYYATKVMPAASLC